MHAISVRWILPLGASSTLSCANGYHMMSSFGLTYFLKSLKVFTGRAFKRFSRCVVYCWVSITFWGQVVMSVEQAGIILTVQPTSGKWSQNHNPGKNKKRRERRKKKKVINLDRMHFIRWFGEVTRKVGKMFRCCVLEETKGRPKGDFFSHIFHFLNNRYWDQSWLSQWTHSRPSSFLCGKMKSHELFMR